MRKFFFLRSVRLMIFDGRYGFFPTETSIQMNAASVNSCTF